LYLILLAVPSAHSQQIAKNGSVGAGLGAAYGTLGLNVDVSLHDYFSLSGGIGTTVFAGAGYAIGARGYMRPRTKMWRPRISVHYGVNGLIAVEDEDAEKFAGLILGAGFNQMFGTRLKHGFDFEIVYMATDGGLRDKVDDMNDTGRYTHMDYPGKVKILLGYRIGF